MILYQRIAQPGRLLLDRRIEWLAVEGLKGGVERRFQEPTVTKAITAACLSDQITVDQGHLFGGQPVHLASSS